MNINDLKVGDELMIKNAYVAFYIEKKKTSTLPLIRNSFNVSYVSVDYIIERHSFLFGEILLNAKIDGIVNRNEYK